MKMKMTIRYSCLALALFAVAGCRPHFEMFAAKDFVELGEGYPYDYRATTPDGLVMGVREIKNDEERGDVEFWVRAIENEMRLNKGYALLDKKEVKTKKGLTGTQIRFGLDREDTAHVYLITVFVTERGTLTGKKSRVYVVEAGGTEDLVKRHQKQIDWSISEFIGH
jgi:hypothetical protein